MRKNMTMIRRIISLFFAFLFIMADGFYSKSVEGESILGLQSPEAIGEKKVLMVVVRFPDATPTTSMEALKKRVISGLNSYVKEQSYGLASIKSDFRGYVMLPDPLADYKVSPYNFKVDRKRVRKLIEDTMTAIEKETDFSLYDHMLIIPAVQTMPGKGYGMICYCANPGMLSGVTKKYVPRYETLRSKGGKEFKGGIFLGAENAHLGMFAHDYFHAIGGIQDDKRLVPCLYDFERQSDASAGTPSFEHHAVYMGFWDIMSQHLVKQGEPPPGLSSFTKIRLGWIKAHQSKILRPGETSDAFLSPLSRGGELIVVKIPLDDGTYYLVENRQPIGYDKVLPDSGILILKVNPDAYEGYGTVEVKSAGGARNFQNATYKLEVDNRNIFIDKKNNIAVIPLWKNKDNLGVLVTTPDHSADALKAATALQTLMERSPGSSGSKKEKIIRDALTAFKSKDFAKSYAIAEAGIEGR
jgi:M6 family metalloprotease-like protein